MPSQARATAGPPGDGMWRGESLIARWRRRALTIPLLLLATALDAALLPALLLYALASDLLRRRPLMLCRFQLTIFAVLVGHCAGVVALGLWWLTGTLFWRDLRTWRRWHGRLESWWSYKIIGIARVLYGLRVEVEGAELVAPGPVLMLMRHASIVNTMLPMGYLGGPRNGMTMRTVKKRELLWNPGVDLISSRLPRTFVRRGSGDPRREVDALCRLTDGMDDDDALAMFPEGTRRTPAKAAELLAKLEVRDPVAAEHAARLGQVLPMRPAGTAALLDHRPDLDLVFCAHTGLEGASRLEDFLSGALLGRTWKIKLWRYPRAEVPVEAAARRRWLQARWEEVNVWIDQHRQYGGARRRWIAERYRGRQRPRRDRRAA